MHLSQSYIQSSLGNGIECLKNATSISCHSKEFALVVEGLNWLTMATIFNDIISTIYTQERDYSINKHLVGFLWVFICYEQ